MKKILFVLLFIFAFLIGKSQPDIAPLDSGYHNILLYGIRYYIPTKRPWLYLGNKYKNIELTSYKQTRYSLDSLALASDSLLAAKIDTSQRGATNGVASLVGGKVPTSQISDALLGAVMYKGAWSAVNDIPELPLAATENKGFYYYVEDSAEYLGITYQNKDFIISNGEEWQRIGNSNTPANALITDTYEYEITEEGLATKTLPFVLRDKTRITYSGSTLALARWSGMYTNTLSLNIPTSIYDYVTVYSVGSSISPTGYLLWKLDTHGNLTPLSTGTIDSQWQLDAYGNITPLVTGVDNGLWVTDTYGNLTPA